MSKWSYVLAVGGMVAGLGSAQAQDAPTDRDKLYFPPCAPFAQRYTFDCYHSYPEVARFLEDAAAAYPRLARRESIGKSYLGRDLWLITITDFGTGDPEDKPAIWVDGGIDSDEVVAIEAALGVVHRLLTSTDSEVVELLRTNTFYIAPTVIPDASELHHTTPERPRDTTLRPWDDDGDGQADEDGVEDLDGDDQALQMRKIDPSGPMVLDERDSRLMRERRPDDDGPFYRVYLEGIDNDGDGLYQEDRLGGIDPNRNYPGNWSINQGGSGPFPGSEYELRAMLDFIMQHPNIAASQHFHSSGGVVLRPPSVPNVTLPAADLQLYLAVSRRGLEVTGYDLATSVYDWNWPRGSRNTRRGQVYRNREGDLRGFPIASDNYPAYGGSIDALYELFGALSFAVEIYQMGEDLDGDGTIDNFERLQYNDDHMNGAAFREWTTFDHPQLGTVEIGGWRKFGQNNPLSDRLPEEVRRNVEFVLMQARNTPRLEITEAMSEDLGGGVYRVKATVRNAGFQPTELQTRLNTNRALPVRVSLDGESDLEVLSGEASVNLGTLQGHEERDVEWLVRGSRTVTVTARHPKSGVARETVPLR